jgi:predicted nucleic acid-binding protein
VKFHGSSARETEDAVEVGRIISSSQIVAPALIAYETANLIGRHELSHQIGPDQASQAHADLLDLAIELRPHDLVAARAWELRQNFSIYDAT